MLLQWKQINWPQETNIYNLVVKQTNQANESQPMQVHIHMYSVIDLAWSRLLKLQTANEDVMKLSAAGERITKREGNKSLDVTESEWCDEQVEWFEREQMNESSAQKWF